MMNYCCPRPEFIQSVDRDQTLRKEYYPGATGGANRPRRFYSEPSDGEVTQVHTLPPQSPGVQEDDEEEAQDGGDSSAFHMDPRFAEKFDFYFAVPEEDLESFGIPFLQDVIEERMKMKACLSIRDIMPGQPRFEAMAHTLETRCNGKVVFVISKNFSRSEECRFLVHFAKTLDPDAMQAKLIPLEIDRNVQLPRVLEGLSSINYNTAYREKWLGKRLWDAIHGPQLSTLGKIKGFWTRVRSISSPS